MNYLDLKIGEVILLSSGEYSDYRVNGLVKVIKDITEDELKLMVDEVNKQEEWAQQAFIAKLINDGIVEEVDCKEVHLGSYDVLELGR